MSFLRHFLLALFLSSRLLWCFLSLVLSFFRSFVLCLCFFSVFRYFWVCFSVFRSFVSSAYIYILLSVFLCPFIGFSLVLSSFLSFFLSDLSGSVCFSVVVSLSFSPGFLLSPGLRGARFLSVFFSCAPPPPPPAPPESEYKNKVRFTLL